ncbi:ribonuclease E/G [Erythrobacter sp. GH1-10]|uniref:ribonuclease E/G n=1 Tax=Erythrobacter sp. GH1-10 TaxID=3349334 RepID=UPI003877E2B7
MREAEAEDWIIERGIGEDRALLTIDGRVLAAKIHWPGEMVAGELVEAQLTVKRGGKRRGTATTASGQEILVDHLPEELTEGQHFTVAIVRAPIAEKGRFKKAQGRYAPQTASQAPSWRHHGQSVREFASGCWEDIWDAAAAAVVEFGGGSLVFSVTPAMTLIDVDGDGSPREIALAAVPCIASWLKLFDLGGNIGIDFPTIEAKADRKAIDTALGEALADWPHERIAMNGFGFVQIVARLEGPSLLHRFATSRTGMCARMALRRAEMVEGTGAVLLLTVHPAIKAKLKPEWIEELSRRTGKQVRIETEPGLALEASQAQLVAL